MLSISNPLKGASAGQYYLDLARNDYYLDAREPPGHWFGVGAECLGLSGVVQDEPFRHVLAGMSPDGSFPLVQNAQRANRQCGWDLTFSAPKSVSVFWAMASPAVQEQVEAAHQQAVGAALTHLEETSALTRRGRGGSTIEPAAVVFAIFQHGYSRALDPQLHTHAILLNLGLRADGTSGSLLSQPFFEQKLALGALYQTELAAGLRQRIGLTIVPDRVGFHIEGVPDQVCRGFSQRRKQIEAELEQHDASGGVASKIAALETRPEKSAAARDELFRRWQKQGKEAGWGPEQAFRLVGVAHTPSARMIPFERELVETLESIPQPQRTPGSVVPLAARAAIRHGVEARSLLRSLADLANQSAPQLSVPVRVEWHRLFDHRTWIQPRRKLIYTERFQPFPGAWWKPARDLRLPRVRIELPALALGSRKSRSQPGWWKIHWKMDVGVGELRVQDRILFPAAPKWSPAYGLALPALRLTSRRSKSQGKRQDLGHSY